MRPSDTIVPVSTPDVDTAHAAPLLEVNDLHVAFGEREVVHGISFSIAAGETLGLVGESGSGKSAASLAIMGLLPPTAHVRGSIRLNGPDCGAGHDLLTLSAEAMRRH